MSRLFGLLGTLVVSANLLGFEQVPDYPPAEQLKALVKEYQELVDAYHKDIQKVKSEAQRNEFLFENYPQPGRSYPRSAISTSPSVPDNISALIASYNDSWEPSPRACLWATSPPSSPSSGAISYVIDHRTALRPVW